MNSRAYDQGFHDYLDPAQAQPVNDPDYDQGWTDAKAINDYIKSKPTFTAFITDDGLIDMFIVGPDGKPFARVKHPTVTGEDAAAGALAWLAEQEADDEHEA